jgi:HEAT repeat protein
MQLIGNSGCTDCSTQLLAFLSDHNWRVRYFALDTLYKLHYLDSAILRRIIKNDMHETVKAKAIMTLGKCGNHDDAVFLDTLLANEEYRGAKLSKAIDVALSSLKDKDEGARGLR